MQKPHYTAAAQQTKPDDLLAGLLPPDAPGCEGIGGGELWQCAVVNAIHSSAPRGVARGLCDGNLRRAFSLFLSFSLDAFGDFEDLPLLLFLSAEALGDSRRPPCLWPLPFFESFRLFAALRLSFWVTGVDKRGGWKHAGHADRRAVRG